MSEYIHKLLKTHGPCLSSELIDRMVQEGVTHSAARKRLDRASDDVTRLAGLRFPKNQRFWYLEEQFGSRKYWEALESAFKTTGKGYWGAVVGLKAKGGFCPKDRLGAIEVEAPDKVIASLMGHKFHRERYGSGPSLELKKKYLDMIAFEV